MTTLTKLPRFLHDCDQCRYVDQHGDFDLYVCENGVLGPTILARYGDDGPEYASMDVAVIRHNLASLESHCVDVPSTDALLEGFARWECGE